ncbi:hypothetical protein TNCV_2338831 [Trichonephila clavipes]|nr:hypothetical protein TNCV_2338831 [Trichonephila clavipes]
MWHVCRKLVTPDLERRQNMRTCVRVSVIRLAPGIAMTTDKRFGARENRYYGSYYRLYLPFARLFPGSFPMVPSAFDMENHGLE